MEDRSSMIYWHAKTKDLDIPQPRTEFVNVSKEELDLVYQDMVPGTLIKRVESMINEKFSLPVFIRTDHTSDKHGWEKSCFYNGNDLPMHLYNIIDSTINADMIGLPLEAIAVREYIPMDTKFTAFRGKFPVGSERRYFIRGGKTIEHFPYWSEEPIEDCRSFRPSEENWRELLKELNIETKEEVHLLTSYSDKVANVLGGYWSVDFCRAKDGRWIFIDMADGDKSWHPVKDAEERARRKIEKANAKSAIEMIIVKKEK